jgi:hypothetical protein
MSILAAILAASLARPVVAQPAPHAGDIPQSLRVEHDHTLEQLGILSRRKTPVGVEARKALALFRPNFPTSIENIVVEQGNSGPVVI